MNRYSQLTTKDKEKGREYICSLLKQYYNIVCSPYEYIINIVGMVIPFIVTHCNEHKYTVWRQE